MTRGSVGILCLALNVSACGGGDAPQTPLELTPSESAALDRIFVEIKRASRESFDKNDWSIMAKLYPENSLACWNASGEDHRFGFLSMKPIPENAAYTVAGLENYIFGGVDTSKNGWHSFHVNQICRNIPGGLRRSGKEALARASSLPQTRGRKISIGTPLSGPGTDRSEVYCPSVARYERRARRGHSCPHECQ